MGSTKTSSTAAEVYAEYEQQEAERAERNYVVTLHYDEHPLLDSRVVWQGQGYWQAQRWAQGAVKSLICTTAHGYVDFTSDGMTHNAYRPDYAHFGSNILVGHATVEEVPTLTAPEPDKPARVTQKRQSAEARRNAKAEVAYRTMVYRYGVPGQPTHEYWTVPSTSEAGKEYTMTRDLAHDRYHCSCLAGQHERACCHVDAAKRAVNDRRAADASYAMYYGEYTAW